MKVVGQERIVLVFLACRETILVLRVKALFNSTNERTAVVWICRLDAADTLGKSALLNVEQSGAHIKPNLGECMCVRPTQLHWRPRICNHPMKASNNINFFPQVNTSPHHLQRWLPFVTTHVGLSAAYVR